MSVEGLTGEASVEAVEVAPESAAPEAAAVEPVKPEPPKDDKFAAKFVALRRKEQEIREKEKATKTREAELTKRLAELEERSKGEKSLAEKFKQNPLTALQELGITYDQLSEMVLNEGNPTTEMQLKRMRDEIKNEALSEVEQLKKQLKEREEREEKARFEATVNHFKTEIKNAVDSNEDKYELVKAQGAYDLVFEVMQEFYNSNETIMGVEDAIAAVEAHLEEEASKILKLKKFQTSKAPAQPEQGKQSAPTLTNTLSTDVPTTGKKNLSKEEALQEAMKHLRWTE